MRSTLRSEPSKPTSLGELRLAKLRRLKELQQQRTDLAQAEAERARRLYEQAESAERAELDAALQRIAGYLYDPVGWCRTCIDWPDGQDLTDYQVEVMAALPRQRKIAVRGPHGLGKTAVLALVVLWFAVTRQAAGVDWKVITTAGAWRHLEVYLWPEIHKWARRIRRDLVTVEIRPQRELLSLSLKLQLGAATAVASDDHENIEGAHADSLLYLFDESKSIDAAVFDAAEGAFSGGRVEGLPEAFAVAFSTPGAPTGRFYEIHQRKPGFEDWWTRHVTVDEAIAAGRISPDWVERRARQWGRKSALFANRVLGEFHADDEDGVIPLAWVEAAIDRWHQWAAEGRPERPGRRIVSADIARFGMDKTVIGPRQGSVLMELRPYAKADTMETTGRIAGLLHDIPQAVAVVDVLNMGGGVVDRLREQGWTVVAFNASEGTARRDRSGELGFKNTRSAAWWNLREMLDPAYGENIALPPTEEDRLVSDLTTPKWKVVSGGKIQVESKDEIRKRLGRSPDYGDTAIQAFWVPSWVVPAESAVARYDDSLDGSLPSDSVTWS